MNKIFYYILALFICLIMPNWVNAQTVVVQTNNGISTTNNVDPNVRYINGIPSTQDIGGVDVEQPICGYYEPSTNYPIYEKFVFTNYNPFPVTVLYEYGNLSGTGTLWSTVGTIVIPAASNGNCPKKEVEFGRYKDKLDIVTITRKIGN